MISTPIRAALLVLCFGILSPGLAARAQGPADKAQEAIGIYASIIAVSVTCNLPVAPPAQSAIDENLKRLATPAGLNEGQVDGIIRSGVEKAGLRKAELCLMDRVKFERFIGGQVALAAEAGAAAGVSLAAIPGFPRPEGPPVPTVPPTLVPPGMLPRPADEAGETATQLLIMAHLVEAVADECEIDLSDDDSNALEKAQNAFRAKVGASEAQINALTDRLESEVEKDRRNYCTPRFDMRGMLRMVLDAAR